MIIIADTLSYFQCTMILEIVGFEKKDIVEGYEWSNESDICFMNHEPNISFITLFE